MKILPTVLALAISFSSHAVSASNPPTRSDPVLVRAVIDGDTIEVAGTGRVRLLGIDAPEIGRVYDTPAPFAFEARARLSSLVLHRFVRLEQDGAPIDSYNRRLAYVVLEDGLFVNAVLVREGFARLTARVPLARLDELKRAEREAQAFKRGMWAAASARPASYTRPSAGRRKAPSLTTNGRRRSSHNRSHKRHLRSSWQRSPSSTRRRAKFASATSCITASTTGRFGSSCSSSRRAR